MAELTDRELDVQVAEKVMGLVPCQGNGHANGDLLPCHSPTQGAETRCYSTDIEAAMDVLKRFTDAPWGITYSDHPSAQGAPYSVTIYRRRSQFSSTLIEITGEALSVARAICLTALAAKNEVIDAAN